MDFPRATERHFDLDRLTPDNKLMVANLITTVEQAKSRENGHLANLRAELKARTPDRASR